LVGFGDRTGRAVDEASLDPAPGFHEARTIARRERPDVKLLDSLGTLFEPGFGIPAVAACLHGARIFSATELSAQAGCPALPLHQEHCDACDQNHDEGDDQRYFRGA
jgi:hypothetical protein